VCEAVGAAVEALEVGAAARKLGVPLVDVVDDLISQGGRTTRLAAADAFHDFERAVGEMRAGVVGASSFSSSATSSWREPIPPTSSSRSPRRP
jgi:hypothetical protein